MTSAQEADPRYVAALRRLEERGRFGIRLGLARTRALLRRLGNPERDLPGVLIGGTNGKGSVQALVAAALCEAGRRVGQTPKPHLVSYRERIIVDGRRIGVGEFAALIEEVLAEAEAVERRHGPPTEFELLTAAAFHWFRRRQVDLGVVEVGMGGRLDATNAWQGGISAITNVALDHTQHLGPTIEAIAREKSHIIKRGDLLALTSATGAGRRIISRRAGRLAVPLRVVEPPPVLAMDRAGITLQLNDGSQLRVGLLGRHQAVNAGLAMAIVQGMGEAGMVSVPPAAMRRAFSHVQWPGRLELLRLRSDGRAAPAERTAPDPGQPDVLLDGAHNPAGTAALAAALDELRPLLSPGRPTLLLGVLRDKDVAGMLEPLLGCHALREAMVITTDVPGTSRSLPAGELSAAWQAGARATGSRATRSRRPMPRPVADVDAALEEAVGHAQQSDGPLFVCGSLYLVGHLRGRLVADEGD